MDKDAIWHTKSFRKKALERAFSCKLNKTKNYVLQTTKNLKL